MNPPPDDAAKDAAQTSASLHGVFPIPQPTGPPTEASLHEIQLPEETEPPRPGVRKAALRSALWLGGGFVASTVLKLISASILTRLLAPTVYALMDVANVFLQGLHMFSDVGIGTAVVQSKRGEDRAFLNTAWTMHVGRGFVLWLATLAIAWPVAAIYNENVLVLLIPALGLTAAIEGFKSTAIFTLDRRLLQGRAVLMDLAYGVLGVAVTVGWAYAVKPDVWALFAGGLAQTLLVVALSYLLLPGYGNWFHWDKEAAHELFTFGKWIFLGTVVTYLAFQADRLLLPKAVGLELAGIYGRAGSLAGMATALMSTFVTKLIFPVYSRLHQEGRDIRAEFGRVHFTAAAFAALLVIGMLSAGPAACRTLYGAAYQDSAWMLQIVAVGAWFQMLEGTTGASLLALGQPRAITVSNFSRLVGVLAFVPVGYWVGGFNPWGGEPEWQYLIGMLAGFIAADFLRYLVTVWLARQNGMWGVHLDVIFSGVIALLAPAAYYGGAGLARLVVGPDAREKVQHLTEFLCQGVLAVVLWGMVFAAWWSLRKRRVTGATAGEVPREPGQRPDADA